ncbi:hypothetical protein A4A58_28100 [Tardiphaga robiniae]|uniref:Uncharacterized protein n=2 Tax=Tardiphaga robiniae TaxID=943830 RepID=A0A163Z187_9BRAD|nr:hypothetical protein A4A58_28100 [Tardiphaga robiniae]
MFLASMEAEMNRDMGELLDHVPLLVKAYGRWPSYVYLLLFTPLSRGLLGAMATIAALVVYHQLR